MPKQKDELNIAAEPGTSMKNMTGTWRTYKPIFDHEKCIGCAMCEQVCPEGCTYNVKKKNKAGKEYREVDLDYCKGCGICAEECPVKCIKMELEEK